MYKTGKEFDIQERKDMEINKERKINTKIKNKKEI